MAATEENGDSASEMPITVKALCFERIGWSLPLLAGATRHCDCCCKYNCAFDVAATLHDDVVSFNHYSPSLTSFFCASVNTIAGVFPREILSSL